MSAFSENLSFEGQTIAGLFFKSVDENPKKKAIYCDGKEMDYTEFCDFVCRYANYLTSHGVEYGDIIGIPMTNSIESVALIMAAALIGVGLTPINPTLPVYDIDKSFRAGNVRHLIARKAFFKGIEGKGLDYITGCKLCLDGEAEGADPFSAVYEASPERPDYSKITGDETYILTMTSGSTGAPKPIELTQNNKLIRSEVHIKVYDITPDDNILTASPLYHSLAERLVLIPFLIGAKATVLPRFTPRKWIECVKEQKATFAIPVSAQITQIVQEMTDEDSREITSLRSIVSTSALLELKVKEQILEKLHCDVNEMYGTSECSTVTSVNFRESMVKLQSVGKALPGAVIKIIDEKGNEVPRGTVGDVVVKTNLIFKGYYGMPEKTAEATTADGFFKTGDLGSMDEDGYLYFKGRKKELIITGGANVYPQDIENKLRQIPEIWECAAFPYPDDKLGEVVAIAISVKDGMELTKKDVKRFCARNLADFQQPHKIFFLPELPKNSLGKLTKMALPKAVEGMEG